MYRRRALRRLQNAVNPVRARSGSPLAKLPQKDGGKAQGYSTTITVRLELHIYHYPYPVSNIPASEARATLDDVCACLCLWFLA